MLPYTCVFYPNFELESISRNTLLSLYFGLHMMMYFAISLRCLRYNKHALLEKIANMLRIHFVVAYISISIFPVCHMEKLIKIIKTNVAS